MPDPLFFNAYRRGSPPWDIGRAQPAFVELANAGQIHGAVLDVGCGTGDIVLEMAERGHEAWGIDIVPMAIDQAKAKARLRCLSKESKFVVGDALELERLGRTFDTVIDCGLFHSLSDPERQVYVQQLGTVMKEGGVFHLMVMSDWEDTNWGGPRRIGQQEIIEAFSMGWRIDDIQEARFTVRPPFRIRAHAWLVSIVREAPPPKKRRTRKQANAPEAVREKPKTARKHTKKQVEVTTPTA